jgi:hypothetical protein
MEIYFLEHMSLEWKIKIKIKIKLGSKISKYDELVGLEYSTMQ